MSLTEDQRKYFDDMEAMFAGQGWRKHLMDSVLQQFEDNVARLTENELTDGQIREIRGGVKVMKSLLDLERMVALEKEYAENPPEDVFDGEEDDNASAAI